MEVLFVFMLVILFSFIFSRGKQLPSSDVKNTKKKHYLPYEREELERIKMKYSRKSVETSNTFNKPKKKSGYNYDTEIIDCYLDYISEGSPDFSEDKTNRISATRKRIDDIFTRAAKEYDELSYLKNRERVLESLCKEYDSLFQNYHPDKLIRIKSGTNHNKEKIATFFSRQHKTRRIQVDRNDVSYNNQEAPFGFTAFDVDETPVIITIKNKQYCIFSQTILVFDEDGSFYTALRDSALSVSAQKNREVVRVRDGRVSRTYTDTDSKRIQERTHYSYWDYETKSGLPDKRYKNNYHHTSYEIEKEYGIFKITLGSETIEFAVSNPNVIADLV